MRYALLLLSLFLTFTGCGSPPPTPPQGDTYTVRGQFLGAQYEGQAVIINHEPIPDVMEAMRMSFRVHDPDAWAPLAEGTPVSFTLIATETGYVLMQPEVLPDTTRLELAE